MAVMADGGHQRWVDSQRRELRPLLQELIVRMSTSRGMNKPISITEVWANIEKGIKMLTDFVEWRYVPASWEDQLRRLKWEIYKMCEQEHPHGLDFQLQLNSLAGETLHRYITSEVLPSFRVMLVESPRDSFSLLWEFADRWARYCTMVWWIDFLFHYPIEGTSVMPIPEVGRNLFRDLVYMELYAKVRDIVISLIDSEREGGKVDRRLLKEVLIVFVDMGIEEMDRYEGDFEASLLEKTAAYYSEKASIWMEERSGPDNKHSFPDYMLKKVQHELLFVYANQRLDNKRFGCHALLRKNKVEDWSRMFRLFSNTPRGLDLAADIFKQYVAAEVTALVRLAEDAASNKEAGKYEFVLQEQDFVWKVIELHDKHLAYVNGCFQNHALFHQALKEAFEIFCNRGVGGCSITEQRLATFCDKILKKGDSEKLSDEAIEGMLEKVVKLLAYISDKDLFAEFYSILTKLKQQGGGQFTLKMKGMVTDLISALETQAGFEEYLSNNPNANPGINLTVTVLTTGFWPRYKPIDLNLPAEMVRCIEVFKDFYQTKTKDRKLTWIHSLGTCNIIGKFEPKTMELIVTTCQASVLLLFNTSERLSYSEIMNQLNLSDDDVVRILHSLSCAKYKILNKMPNTKTILWTDHFEFNAKFTDKMRRIKIPLPPVNEEKKVIEDVDEGQCYAIDASIVYIMKRQEVLGHQQLVKQCVGQLGCMFKPGFKAIKKRIENLIAQGYLERDKDDPDLFRYCA